MRHRLEKNPNDAVAHMNLGAILLSRLDPQAAVTRAAGGRAAGAEAAGSSQYAGLGAGHAEPQRGRHPCNSKWRCEPARTTASARFNLATALAKSGRIDEAIANLRQILAANPDDAYAKRRLAELEAARHPPVHP